MATTTRSWDLTAEATSGVSIFARRNSCVSCCDTPWRSGFSKASMSASALPVGTNVPYSKKVRTTTVPSCIAGLEVRVAMDSIALVFPDPLSPCKMGNFHVPSSSGLHAAVIDAFAGVST